MQSITFNWLFFTMHLACLPGYADTIIVDVNGFADYDTIQEAIDAAEDGDQIIVLPGVYAATDPTSDAVFDLRGKDITVDSFAGPKSCIIDAEFSRRGILCTSGAPETARISGMTIRNGATLLENGAGILVDSSDLTIQNCLFVNNTALGSGGAIHIENGNPVVRDCTFTSNNAVNGGAINAYKNDPDDGSQMRVTIEGCDFTDNEASTQGSGIQSIGLDQLSAIDLTMTGSISSNQSDFIASYSTTLMLVSDSTFTTTGWSVGEPDRSKAFSVIDLEGGMGLVRRCTFNGFVDSNPVCAIRATACDLALELVEFVEHGSFIDTNNVIDAYDSNLELSMCYWDFCDGTLLAADGEGSVSIQNSHLISLQSTSPPDGSGYGIVSGANISLQITNCIFSGLARGVYCHDHGGLSISGSTFEKNGYVPGKAQLSLNSCHLQVQGNAMKDSIEIVDCLFDTGQVWSNGQGASDDNGVTLRNVGTTEISRCVFSNNSGAGPGSAYGSALSISADDFEDTPISITDCEFSSNGGGEGGLFGGAASALSLGDGPSTVRNTIFRSNLAWTVGAVDAVADLSNCLFISNLASIDGIGTASINGSMTDCTIVSSNADCGFGALVLSNCALNRVTILQGRASNDWKSLPECCRWDDDQLGGCIHIPDGSQSKDNCVGGTAELVTIRNSMICNGTPTEIYGVYEDLGQNFVASVCCQADITHDGIVNGADLAVLLAGWGESCLGCQIDLNFDGLITGADLAELLAEWNECGS